MRQDTCQAEMGSSRSMRAARSFHRLIEIALVHLDADEAQSQLLAGDGGRSQPEERVGDDTDPVEAVKTEAHLGQLRRKGRRVRAILLAALDGLVRDEPRIPAAPYT